MAPRGKDVAIATKELILKLHSEGKSLREIGKIIGRTHTTVQSLINKFKNHGTVETLPGRGRKKILSSYNKRYIERKIKENPKISLPKLTEEVGKLIKKPISVETVRRSLKSEGYNGRVARKKPFISKANQKKRLEFAKNHLSKPKTFWNKVIFSDESKFNIFGSDGRQIVWRKKNTEFEPKHTKSTVKHGGGSVMVWGCFSANGVGNLVFIDGIMDRFVYLNILKQNLADSANKMGMGNDYCFQQDNDPKHTAHIVRDWIGKSVPNQLKTPPQSPDMNPIENLWDELDCRIRKRTISNKNTLKKVLQEEWFKIGTNTTQKLIDSMNNRLLEVAKAKGGPTKY